MGRWLLRLLIFWGISAPLFYVFGLPAALDFMSRKISRDNYAQCLARLTSGELIVNYGSELSQSKGESYCHCTSDSLTFTRNDLWDTAQKKQPAELSAMAQSLADQCNAEFRAAPTATSAPAPDEGVIYIN